MADVITGKIWSLDTATAIVSTAFVNIHSVRVRFTTAAAGSFIMTGFRRDPNQSGNNIQEVLLDLRTTAASTAVVFSLDKEYFFGDQTFQGLAKTLCVNVDTVYVVTGVPK